MASLLFRSYSTAARFISSSAQPFPYIEARPASIFHRCVDLIPLCPSTSYLSQVHTQLIGLGLIAFWAPKLLKRSSELGDLTYSVSLFKCIDSPGTFCVNNVLRAYSVGSSPEKTVAIYFEFLRDGQFIPNSYSFLYLIGSCVNFTCLTSGMKCHAQMLKHGLSCLPVHNSLVFFYGACGRVELARNLFEEMPVRDVISWNSIVSGYIIVGKLSIAHDLFDSMPEKNVISWNIMLSGYLKNSNPDCVLVMFRRMISIGITGNERTLATLITACGRLSLINEGRCVHGFALRSLKVVNLIISTSLVDMYSKCRRVETAQHIFNGMSLKNLVSWNAMILGHCIHGNPLDGLNLFEELIASRQGDSDSPDQVTFIGVLCACARLAMVSEGQRFFRQMSNDYGIQPNFAHYWCLANVYIEGGLHQAAKSLLQSYGDGNLLVDLLIECRFDGSSTAAETMAKYFIEIDSSEFCHYHFLANMYAAAGKWDEVMKVKEMAKTVNRKVPTVGLHDLNYLVENYSTGLPWQDYTNIANVCSPL